jgi:hypothetical protein
VSIFDKAEKLTARARTHTEGGKERADRQQIATMLGQLEEELQRLKDPIASYVAARSAGVQLPAVSAEVTAGIEVLQGRVEQGLPTPQALRSARDRVRQSIDAVSQAVVASWRPWSENQLESMQLASVSLLPIQDRKRAEIIVSRLRGAAVTSLPSAPVIAQFLRDVGDLQRSLEHIDRRGPLARLLDRIRAGQVTLADLSRDEVDLLLSQDDVASQIVLRLV